MQSIFNTFRLSFKNFVANLPAILGAIVCLVVTVFLANVLSRLISKYALKRTKDPLISNFLGKIV